MLALDDIVEKETIFSLIDKSDYPLDEETARNYSEVGEDWRRNGARALYHKYYAARVYAELFRKYQTFDYARNAAVDFDKAAKDAQLCSWIDISVHCRKFAVFYYAYALSLSPSDPTLVDPLEERRGLERARAFNKKMISRWKAHLQMMSARQ